MSATSIQPHAAPVSDPESARSIAAEREAAAKAFHEQALFVMEQKYATDERGDARSAKVQTELAQELQAALTTDARVQSIDCRLKTCRV